MSHFQFRDAYAEVLKAFHKKVDEAITAAIGTGSESEARRILEYASYSYWLLYPAYQNVDKMYEPLWLLREVFTDIQPWELIYDARDSFRDLLDRAFYTFEERYVEYKV
jgi:hypothetical protein